MHRILFIGLNPTKLSIPRKGGAWHRFCQWLDEMSLPQIVSFTNLSPDPYWGGKEIDTEFFLESIGGYDKIVVWGPKVSERLKKMGIEHFVLPHPSPLNRQINNSDYIRQCLENCKKYLNGV
jgi:hypothetical protein